ncbi:catabolic L-serine/threonine dehydratase [Podospora australis]|uniref:L-serine ammonia-lyase n=1 Tax=Podospora australis TaxID=1536484 RepID=A0AAN6X2U9_9PEZI|nr:catabolic L-serine/threonine dehydratase [Podospora australis]
MGSMPTPPAETALPKPWVETPLVFSAPLSRQVGCNIYLKLENVQPSGSFKSRGIGNMMLQSLLSSPPSSPDEQTQFLCSSGGNAGLACATTALSFPNAKAIIVVPLSTSPFMIAKLQELGGVNGSVEVVQAGESWVEADTYLREELLAKSEPGVRKVYVPPFDHPDVWTGASSLVDELVQQFPVDKKMDAVVCNVGGGGLVNGICQGIERHLKTLGARPKVLAIETVGADSLYQSVQAGKLVTLPAITSIATSLGARTVSNKTWEWACSYGEKQKDFISSTVTDREAARACLRFLDDARIMVEVSCGATLAPAYNGTLKELLGKDLTEEEWKEKNVVLVVCGGSNVSWEILEKYKQVFDL